MPFFERNAVVAAVMLLMLLLPVSNRAGGARCCSVTDWIPSANAASFLLALTPAATTVDDRIRSTCVCGCSAPATTAPLLAVALMRTPDSVAVVVEPLVTEPLVVIVEPLVVVVEPLVIVEPLLVVCACTWGGEEPVSADRRDVVESSVCFSCCGWC